jgi:SAM-dependent methyltransferase
MNIFLSVKYSIIALILKIFSSTEFLRSFYRFLGNNFGSRHVKVSPIEIKRGNWLVQIIIEMGLSSNNELEILEVGTGWTHYYSIYLRLFLNAKMTLFDIQDNRNITAFYKRCINLLEKLSVSTSDWLYDGEENEKARAILKNIIAVNGFDELYKLLNMTYQIDLGGTLDSLRENTYDVVFSVDVFEHVGIESLVSTIRNIHRLLKPGGLSIHQIGLDDHLAHYVPGMPSKNYLKYSSFTWKLFFENKLQYINRLQLPQFLSAFDENGFVFISSEIEEDAALGKIYPNTEFLQFDRSILNITRAYLIHRKPVS